MQTCATRQRLSISLRQYATVVRRAVCSAAGVDRIFFLLQEVDRVVSRVRARENEQHDALSPVLSYVNANMQVMPQFSICCWE